ncbi:MAG: glycosyltransferase family 2 protein [Firmicutes bacterium]|nr:glycosyltransferase family 2 protein [Bacillota bacterium]
MVKVSIIVPVYNTEKYLRRCLDHLINQTLKEIEIIIVDDGSTDASTQIIQEYAQNDSRIIVFHKKNGGQGSARNLGIRNARGEYIGFADSDDYVDQTLYEKLYKKAKEAEAEMVECKYCFVDENGNKLKSRGNIREYKSQKDMFIDPMVAPWNKIYHRKTIQHRVQFPEGYIYEDTSFYIKAIPYVYHTAHVNEALVHYVLHETSTINQNKNAKVGDIIPVLKDAIEFFKRNGCYETYYSELEYFCSKIILCSSLGRIGRIKDKNLQDFLYDQSFEFLKEEFPKYIYNTYLHGKSGLYMRHVDRWNCDLYGTILGMVLKG